MLKEEDFKLRCIPLFLMTVSIGEAGPLSLNKAIVAFVTKASLCMSGSHHPLFRHIGECHANGSLSQLDTSTNTQAPQCIIMKKYRGNSETSGLRH